MTGLGSRFAMLVATAAVAPLLLFGLVSVSSLRSGTRQSVTAGNLNLAQRAADQIDQYITSNTRLLEVIAADLRNTNLSRWQQERIVRNYVLAFGELRSITLLDEQRRPVVSTHIALPSIRLPDVMPAESVALTAVEIDDDDLLPRTNVFVRVESAGQTAGWLVAELSLEEIWRVVDAIRVGEEGIALLVDEKNQLIAHGSAAGKALVAQGEPLRDHPLLRNRPDGPVERPWSIEYTDGSGTRMLGVAAPVGRRGWHLVIEQPTHDAYFNAVRLERQLMVAITVALLLTVGLGYLWGRSFIGPISTLMRGTQALAEGRLDERVSLEGAEEFRQLGDAFNTMASRLVELQQEARRQERQAMFGRVAAGLVHDLSHPIQNIGNSCRLILKMADDAQYREVFKRTVDREFATIRRVLEDLRNLARPIPLERFPIDVNRSLQETVENMQPLADAAGLRLELEPGEGRMWIEGDRFALSRVYRNLILNAIQATAPGGLIVIRTARLDQAVRIEITDTGCGIPAERLQAIFEDFVTTKHEGLGLGLAISRKIVEQLRGSIRAASEVGRGTTFAIELPATDKAPAAEAFTSVQSAGT